MLARIYIKKNIQKGEKIKLENLKIKRPLNEFDPSSIIKIIGKKAIKNLTAGTSLKKKYFR